MEDRDEGLIYLGGGPLAAVLLGMAFVPFRGFSTASNFTFAFMALTIVVAEFGGRWAAVATALVSALSLDFFLTQPYLRITIADKHDIIAFLGLGACGLVAAALGSQRGQRVAALRESRKHLEVLHVALGTLETAGPLEPQLTQVLNAARATFPLAAAVVRDGAGHALAASERSHGMPVPTGVLQSDVLLPAGTSARDLPRPGLALPAEGGRVALVAGNRQVGWLDLWGNGAPASVPSRRALSDLARLLAQRVAAHGRGPDPPG